MHFKYAIFENFSDPKVPRSGVKLRRGGKRGERILHKATCDVPGRSLFLESVGSQPFNHTGFGNGVVETAPKRERLISSHLISRILETARVLYILSDRHELQLGWII